MSCTDFIVDNMLARVRDLLRQHDASYTRHVLDVMLGDIERDLREDADKLVTELLQESYDDDD
jgi:hypothetical protein